MRARFSVGLVSKFCLLSLMFLLFSPCSSLVNRCYGESVKDRPFLRTKKLESKYIPWDEAIAGFQENLHSQVLYTASLLYLACSPQKPNVGIPSVGERTKKCYEARLKAYL